MGAIHINEVGPRDGLQNEKALIATDVKVAFVNALSASGVGEIEASSFVSPKWVPQLADAEEVFQRIARRPGVVYSAVVPNAHGLERALAAKADRVSVVVATSETFSQRNTNSTIAGSLERVRDVLAGAIQARVPVRGYVSTAFYCPFEGKMAPEKAIALAEALLELGCDLVGIADTIGKASSDDVARILELAIPRFGVERLALHLHDTYGHAVDNALVAYRMGLTSFDASTGGIGGCPYAPGAPGNVATEPLARALAAAGAALDLDYEALARARAVLSPSLGRSLGPGPNLARPQGDAAQAAAKTLGGAR